ncbi:MAG: ATP-binding protein [Prolixibacteraceae bacterium]|nr:ATP-binding protein [Prolixibacteraceae bacterium]MBT6006511.1 ATP-binding protein [Prolixibacteraceae bacterium]MBT6764622.1 ATP-binding protein [Prolixibacteraceae bacterium]MBT6997521.1 ATP-binding protein [Prolixibacteraceae bacterium]MBT7394585.1 ATP-binding protein [Prolixibacteraceae bacterium]
MEAKKITYSYVASLDVLESIREMLTQAGNDIGLSKRKTYQLTLAIDEIATNVIKYGYQEAGISDGFFDLIIEFKEGELIVSLEDTATPFNPIEHSLPTEEDLNIPLEERPIGGLGVMIARQSVDEFKYEFVNNKNRNIFIVKTN